MTTGTWIYGEYDYAHCSECGFEYDKPEYVTRFCPNCGADMEYDADDECDNEYAFVNRDI